MLAQNHFELLGLPVAYDVDQERLTTCYRELQNSVHPDRYANASGQERRLSMQRAAQINDAYNTLKDPLRRAIYMLELAGVDPADAERPMEPAFLMEQMELREQLAGVRQQDDPLAAVGEMIASLGGRLQEMAAELGGLLSRSDEDSLRQAADRVRKMQFLYRLRDEAGALEADLEDELL